MDLTMLRSLVTLVSFVVFVGIVWWALSARNRQRFDEAAMLPFAETPNDPESRYRSLQEKTK